MGIFGRDFISAFASPSPASQLPSPAVKKQNTDDLVATYYNNANLSDVTIAFSGRELKCHKLVLSLRSEYFSKLCDPETPFCEKDKKVIELQEDDADAVEAVIKYLYTGGYGDDSSDQTTKWRRHYLVAQTAEKYLVPCLKESATEVYKIEINCSATFQVVLDAIVEVRERFADDPELLELMQEKASDLLAEERDVQKILALVTTIRSNDKYKDIFEDDTIGARLGNRLGYCSSFESASLDVRGILDAFPGNAELLAKGSVCLTRTLKVHSSARAVELLNCMREQHKESEAMVGLYDRLVEKNLPLLMGDEDFRKTAPREILSLFIELLMSSKQDVRMCKKARCGQVFGSAAPRTPTSCRSCSAAFVTGLALPREPE